MMISTFGMRSCDARHHTIRAYHSLWRRNSCQLIMLQSSFIQYFIQLSFLCLNFYQSSAATSAQNFSRAFICTVGKERRWNCHFAYNGYIYHYANASNIDIDEHRRRQTSMKHGKICSRNLHKFWWIETAVRPPSTHSIASINQSITHFCLLFLRVFFFDSLGNYVSILWLFMAILQSLGKEICALRCVYVKQPMLPLPLRESRKHDVDTSAFKCFVWVWKYDLNSCSTNWRR